MWLSRSAAATLFVALVAFATLARAQTSSPSPVAGLTPLQVAAIDRIAETVIERKATPSVAIGVAKAGRLVFAKAYGYRNLDDRVPADPDTAYGIGSNTKQFTAACILMLRDQGKLDVDAPLARYLPGIPHGDRVTVRELLTHTGGYAEFTELDDFDRLANRPASTDQLRNPVHQAALRSLAAYGPRTYTLVAVDRRAPTSTYQYLLRTPRRMLLYVFLIDDDGELGGGDVFDPDPLAPG